MSPSRLRSKLPRLVRRIAANKNLLMMPWLISVTVVPLGAQYMPDQPAPAPSAPPTKDQVVIGTYNFKTDGKATFDLPGGSDPKGTRIEEEHSNWQLRFYRAANNALMAHINVSQWVHRKTTIEDFATGAESRQVTVETVQFLQNVADRANYLTITSLKPAGIRAFRAILINNTPSVMVTTSTQVTQYFRDGRPPQVTDQVRSSNVYELNAQLVIRQWQGANWSTPYAGSITVQNEHPAYITPQGKKWLTIEANWDTQPSQ